MVPEHVQVSAKIRLIPAELAGPRPECFTVAQWHVWQAIEADSELPPDPNGFCSACLPEFKAEQIAKGKCRHRGVVFLVEGEGEDGNDIVGVRPEHERVAEADMLDKDTSRSFHRHLMPMIRSLQIPEQNIRRRLLDAGEWDDEAIV